MDVKPRISEATIRDLDALLAPVLSRQPVLRDSAEYARVFPNSRKNRAAKRGARRHEMLRQVARALPVLLPLIALLAALMVPDGVHVAVAAATGLATRFVARDRPRRAMGEGREEEWEE